MGGMQKHSLILSRLLAEREVRMSLVHIGGEDYSSEQFYEQYSDERKYIEEVMIPWPKGDSLPGHYLRENKKYSKHIYEHFQTQLSDFDLIYAQGFTAWWFLKEKKKGKLNIPVLVNFHGFEMFQDAADFKSKVEQKLFRKAVKFNVLNADGVYSFGGHIDKAIRDIGVRQDKILLHANGITDSWLTNISANEIRNQKRTLTFIGRNERRKGIEELNIALKELIKRQEFSFVFNFIGPIPRDQQILDDRVQYHGLVRDSEKIKSILQHSDCLVCPSHSEGMPTVILEAMASGLAIIATDVGAVSRMMKDNGILLERPDPELLKKALQRMIELNVSELNEMKSNSIAHLKKHFLWDVIADKKVSQFRNVIQASS